MALEWNLKNKSGEVTIEGQVYNWYQGNACMIVIDETDNLVWFASGIEHLKNMFGMTRQYKTNAFPDMFDRLVIYRKNCSQWLKLAEIFAKAFPKIVIEIKEEE